VAARGADHLTLARLRNVLGTACRELRQFEEALEHLLHGRDHLRQAGLPETTLGLHGNLVSLYRRLGRHDQALASVEEGLALAKARDLPTHEARYLAMRGQIYFDLQRFEESVAALEESVARWAEIGSPYGEAIAIMNLADAHLELKQYDRAREAYRRGYDLSKITGLRQGEILGLWGMGRATRHLGDLEVSMEYMQSFDDPPKMLTCPDLTCADVDIFYAGDDISDRFAAAAALPDGRLSLLLSRGFAGRGNPSGAVALQARRVLALL
jgi:tetratricopeptide (TPR) repeat protein